MKNTKLVYLMTGLLATAALPIQAEDTKPAARPDREQLREQYQNLSPEERDAKRKEFSEKRGEEMKRMAKELGVDPEELKKLPEGERRAKIIEAANKKMAELQKKKTDGTITDAEKETLQRMEQRRKMMEGRGVEGRGERPSRPADKKSEK